MQIIINIMITILGLSVLTGFIYMGYLAIMEIINAFK